MHVWETRFWLIFVPVAEERFRSTFVCGRVGVRLPVNPILASLRAPLGKALGIDAAKLIPGEMNNLAWLGAILVGLSNNVLLPLVTGRSLGKMAPGLRIVSADGGHPSTGALIFRQTLGYLLTLGSLGTGFLFSVFSSKGRALHDYLTGTQVVFGNTTIRTRS